MHREPYNGPTLDDEILKNIESSRQSNGGTADRPDDFRSRPPTRGGGRNMQDSSFAFSGTDFMLHILNCCFKNT